MPSLIVATEYDNVEEANVFYVLQNVKVVYRPVNCFWGFLEKTWLDRFMMRGSGRNTGVYVLTRKAP